MLSTARYALNFSNNFPISTHDPVSSSIHESQKSANISEAVPQVARRRRTVGTVLTECSTRLLQVWQRKYHEEMERIQRLESENEAMRDALVKIENMAPGVIGDLVPEGFSRPSSAISSTGRYVEYKVHCNTQFLQLARR